MAKYLFEAPDDEMTAWKKVAKDAGAPSFADWLREIIRAHVRGGYTSSAEIGEPTAASASATTAADLLERASQAAGKRFRGPDTKGKKK